MPVLGLGGRGCRAEKEGGACLAEEKATGAPRAGPNASPAAVYSFPGHWGAIEGE